MIRLNHPDRAKETWIAQELRKKGISARVVSFWNLEEDGDILIGPCNEGELHVQVAEGHVTACCVQREDETKILFYETYFSSIEELSDFLRHKLLEKRTPTA